MKYLQNINSPDDLKKLNVDQLETVCSELRDFIIEQLSYNPGHFGSSLGTVELTVALHYLYNTPYDRLVWDVGHQAYSHKILTGRRDRFSTNRKLGGLSGFTNPSESEYDTFIAGHASTSISAALGMAVSASLRKENRNIVAIIGDGAMTGGLAYEGLNNVCSQPNNLLIILNDNNMSIDNNVGAIQDYLVKLTTSTKYNRFRNNIYQGFKRRNLISEKDKNLVLRFNNSVKSLITKEQNIFEGFNLRYFGPVDGHDLPSLIRILRNIKDMQGPKLLHIKTVKGKGYEPAEKSATVWHAPGLFNVETGERVVKDVKNQPPLYQDVFGHTLVEIAEKDEKIVGVTPAMPTGCSMTYMMDKFSDRSFDVGIAEAHAVTFSAGMAKEGLIPFCNIYSSFMQRAYDQIIHDVALQKLKVIMCLDRAGLVGADGPTHHGVFDLAYMRPIPNLVISAPYNEHELRNLMYTAAYGNDGPFVIRYPRGQGQLINWQNKPQILPIGKGRKLKDGDDIAVLSLGAIGNNAASAISEAEKLGISIAHYDMVFLKPIDEELLDNIAKKFKHIITVENGVIKGGLGSAVLEFLSEKQYSDSDVRVHRIGIADEFITHGSVSELQEIAEINPESILKKILQVYFDLTGIKLPSEETIVSL
ncbi:MAG TPA: 1-deoxy-D-xylulose-5-phosphate synthase [Fermentimonas caenicola]|jgi:1-deoxy-D-xylulose-5-phosphate synthase|uniref:1-deoxy-D-xylulose-5-phosphate synthase n=1 Tax=Fermentimonas caenicola TaxID=1562970 RepID=A0A098BYY7_9BACT|nr:MULTISPECIES: 1-deoxy-D-xylulose-5-phosphate synthase [Lascolabacillus]MBP6175077.1 1-deoxy-D-xylulose-5-phosphate synthase [Fermentimonas sp.]MDI9625223.1 1-deoxy-D-xylulose-5-phosphate synthase [Bacteroidota bacterium]TAH60535.1 MAG: 1-deoxy-D-xylulose-5-phosphate synthase [Fermentimonas caenicola]MBP6196052.1 1-deoxy-D-xylulose-5-phosphate synthase [Fermentimonas sp.]MBP7103533.1 1-deoxy-D-xylulose-5-phosphate synthase [Fermentimonas sp.]